MNPKERESEEAAGSILGPVNFFLSLSGPKIDCFAAAASLSSSFIIYGATSIPFLWLVAPYNEEEERT